MSLVLGTFAFALAGAIVPVLNVEAYLLSVSALAPGEGLWPVTLAAALGQMVGKSALYLAGRGLLHLPLRKTRGRIEAATARLARARSGTMTVVTASAVTGIPPFYAVSVAAGVLRLGFARFFAVGLAGRVVRFAAVFVIPRLF